MLLKADSILELKEINFQKRVNIVQLCTKLHLRAHGSSFHVAETGASARAILRARR